ncbi:hypothetical protein KAW64_07800 [bacterium]|nr:hypothetical protein [bacterium]
MTMFFGFMTALVSIGSGVLIVMLIVKGVMSRDRTRKEAFELALQKGIYDPTIIRPNKRPGGNAALGWGIALLGIGIAQVIGFITLGIWNDAAIGALVPLFVGIGLIIFHTIVKRNAVDIEENGKPIQLVPGVDKTSSDPGQEQ